MAEVLTRLDPVGAALEAALVLRAGQSSSRPVKGKARMMASAVGIKRDIGLSQRFEHEMKAHLNLDQGSAVARDRIEKIVEQLARLEVVACNRSKRGGR
ncbi:hypothetical protein [Sphingopyxis sp. JAI128]|uniref:hypothetical protein n=1 Tax=Sphingopyxis sp. JAI128 TaxID=2723066 RepID=UPI001618274B|nr:hypothetical protein [Sphingopyxis sp. JAI128]MBB6425715.1 hypothetical protein [Sphingopyxis sp. JAI128]